MSRLQLIVWVLVFLVPFSGCCQRMDKTRTRRLSFKRQRLPPTGERNNSNRGRPLSGFRLASLKTKKSQEAHVASVRFTHGYIAL
jgi:hypothetical protein